MYESIMQAGTEQKKPDACSNMWFSLWKGTGDAGQATWQGAITKMWSPEDIASISAASALGRGGHTTVLTSTGTWKYGRPQQYSKELANPGGGRRWLTSLELAAGTSPAHGSRDFEFHHRV